VLKLVLIGVGGFLGAVSRYGLAGLVHRFATGTFPSGTLAVNLLGCFLIGGLMCLAEQRQLLGQETRLLLMVGFLGSFTTLSTVGYETFEYLRAGNLLLATINAGANLLLGLGAVILGWVGAKALGI
jgi:CrcB protein